MERKKSIRKPSLPSLILTSDWHLREDTPTCFTGDWHQEQWKAVKVIRNLQAMYNCPVIHAGDLFHHWKPSPRTIDRHSVPGLWIFRLERIVPGRRLNAAHARGDRARLKAAGMQLKATNDEHNEHDYKYLAWHVRFCKHNQS